ncbi:MAG TPA: hypothetical protein VNH39_13535 [Steroidobacteraceae bacterium]|nr:hypothetical protein [Steroidobacteraceae bacterium]
MSEIDPLDMTPEQRRQLFEATGTPPMSVTVAPQQPAATPLDPLDMTPEQRTALISGAKTPEMSWGDYGRFGMTAAVRGLTGLADNLADPLAPLRRLVSPSMERIEQQGSVHPGQWAGDQIFQQTGIPEYVPTTPRGRVALSATEGAIGGAPLGVFGAGSAGLGALRGLLSSAIGGAGGAAGQTAYETTGDERLATAAGLVPGALAQGGGIAAAAARNRAAGRLTPELSDLGVRPTGGQAIGGMLNRMEEGLSSIPWVGDFMRAGRRDAVEQFNRGLAEQTLNKVGETLNPNTETGHATIGEVGDKLGAKYDAITPHLDTTVDHQFAVGDLNRVRRNASMLRSDQQDEFNKVFKAEITDRLSAGGAIPGQSFREMESEIGRLASDNIHSGAPADRALGRVYADLQGSLRDLQMRSNPQHATELQKIHDAYADFQRLQGAAGKIGADEGIFTPEQLYRSTRELDKSLNHRVFATGSARMQDIAQQGKTVLGNKVPDSGTPFRSFASLAPFVVGSGAFSPASAATMLGTGLAAGRAYSPWGRRQLGDFFQRTPSGMEPFGTGLLTSQDPYGR